MIFDGIFLVPYIEEGVATLFSGIGPRVAWISIGGFIFFGTYEFAKKNLAPIV